MKDSVKKKILDLYFEKMYSVEAIRQYFKDKYSESEIWSVIDEVYAKYKKKGEM